MGGKVFLGVLSAAAVVAFVSIVLGRLSPGSGREAGNSMPTWVLDDHLQSFHKSRVFEPAPGAPPTTPENAVQVAIKYLGGPQKILSTLRVRYVLVSEPGNSASTAWKDYPMWVVQVDRMMAGYPNPARREYKRVLSRGEVLIDARTGRYLASSTDELPSDETGSSTPTPVPGQDTPSP